MKESKPKRERSHNIDLYLTDKELEVIHSKMTQAGIKNRSHFIREIINKGFILDVDLSPINRLLFLLSNATNNLNQIARGVNMGQSIHRDNIETLRQDYNALAEEVSRILGAIYGHKQ